MDRRLWKTTILRRRGEATDGRVSFLELFFDVVFVFTIIQLSYRLAHHYSPIGVVESLILILAVWWVWIYTTWAMNWLDPERGPVQAMLFVLMFLALLLSIAIPQAFESRGRLFAIAIVFMQVGRSIFMASALRGYDERNYRSFVRISCWLAFSGLFWIGGAFAGHEGRIWMWIVAISIEYLSPACSFWVPGLGRSSSTDWNVSGAHIAERCALFIIICFGETILATGRTLANTEITQGTFLGLCVAFATAFGMWWVYFRFGHSRATSLIEHHEDPGAIARAIFTYPHFIIVTGIIVTAVGFEFMLAHPGAVADAHSASAIIAGPVLFVLGNIWLKGLVAHRPPLSHLVGVATMAGLAVLHPFFTNLLLALAMAVLLVVVAAWEAWSLTRHPAEHKGSTAESE